MTAVTSQSLHQASVRLHDARTRHAQAVEVEIAARLALRRLEDQAVHDGLPGHNAEQRAAHLAGLFPPERQTLVDAERRTRQTRLVLDHAETGLTTLRYQVRLLEALRPSA